MQKLEPRFYPMKEIRAIMGTTRKETITNNLTKWNYHYEWIPRKGVEIKETPASTEEVIQEICIRKLGIDIQCDIKAFAAFFYLLSTEWEYQCSPWAEKARMLKEFEGIEVSDRTLKAWYSKLNKLNLVIKDKTEKELWISYRINGVKRQEFVNLNDEAEAHAYSVYSAERKELLKDHTWGETIKILYNQHGCVYYNCNPILFNAIRDEDIEELFTCVEEYVTGIKEEEKREMPVRNSLDCITDNGEFKF